MTMTNKGQPAGWCIHYRRATEHETCEAGQSYEQFSAVKFEHRPCFLTADGRSKPGAVACPHLRLPTPEEIEQNRAYTRERFTWMMAGIVLAAGIPVGTKAVVECPRCKGQLHIIRDSESHNRGACETPDCMAWRA